MISRARARLVAVSCVLLAAVAAGEDAPIREGPRRIDPREHRIGRLVPDLAMVDLAGREQRIHALVKDHRALVIALTGTRCPVSKRYAPVLARLEKAYGPQGVGFLFVDVDAADTPDDMRGEVKSHGLAAPFVPDPQHTIARALGALTSGDAFVLDSAATLVYRGAVDDQYGFGYARESARESYLAAALDAVLAGRWPEVAATWAPGCALESAPDAPAAGPVTFHNRISRILQRHCQECHHDGGLGPFALVAYSDVVAERATIRDVLQRGIMPPWFAAEPEPGKESPWANDRSLPDRDREDLLAWLHAGRLEGDPSDAPLPRAFPKDWQIGTPDAVIEIPEEVAVQAEGQMPYVNLRVETGYTEDRWVSALEVRPTATDVVHHVLVFVVAPFKPGKRRPLEALRERVRERDGFFAAYVPGNGALIYPEGYAKPLPAGSTLLFQLHYTPNGKPRKDRTRLGLVFAKAAPAHVVRTAGIANHRIRIPPGDANHEEKASIPVPADVQVLTLMPHMHYRGRAFQYVLVLPGGVRRTLLEVPRYDFNWQIAYRFREAVDAPRGSRVEATAWYDNSRENPANPDPAKTVTWGPQSTDEMMLGYVEYTLASGEADAEDNPLADAGDEGDGPRGAKLAKAILKRLDRNGDGVLTREELPERFRALFGDYDTNADGKITEEELVGEKK